ncbi:hypothetical protein DSL64_02675 [Dyadobacter luteus]|uniref:AMOP domain-containing protein n=2 Tax=Dyadobacter luteus TaxID=2259619 RepID=A0A3D8YJU6_9BACT|nr:hypothetical protein DSL64_02675 [Dyadobacter luteus]
MLNKKTIMKSIALLALIVTTIFLTETDDTTDKRTWHQQLPPCPCTNPDFNKIILNDGWAKDKGDLDTYHHGATECFRSYPYTKTSAGKSGQQCCYDSNGKLISSGSGAGTPDKASTCSGEDKSGTMKIRFFALLPHYFRDVKPWKQAGEASEAWKIYNKEWVPSQPDCSVK